MRYAIRELGAPDRAAAQRVVTVATAVAPSIAYEASFLAMLADFDANDPDSASSMRRRSSDFGRYVQRLLDEERGIDLSEGRVPCTHRWLIDHMHRALGTVRLRHSIDTPLLGAAGGHVGYDVAASRRGQGISTQPPSSASKRSSGFFRARPGRRVGARVRPPVNEARDRTLAAFAELDYIYDRSARFELQRGRSDARAIGGSCFTKAPASGPDGSARANAWLNIPRSASARCWLVCSSS